MHIVLIETSWNVKVELQIERFFDSLVLIETSWNVKEKKRKKHHKGIIGINRNIVECKVGYDVAESTRAAGINRNIVECKDTSHLKKSHKGCVLIETSWNVKQIRQLEKTKLELCINRNIVECKVH